MPRRVFGARAVMDGFWVALEKPFSPSFRVGGGRGGHGPSHPRTNSGRSSSKGVARSSGKKLRVNKPSELDSRNRLVLGIRLWGGLGGSQLATGTAYDNGD
jgi:hypothetical protein